MPYVVLRTDLFAKQLKGLCKKDKPLEKLLTDAIDEITANPGNFDSTLKGERNRSVKKKAVKEHYRIIYRYCELCVRVHKAKCEDCTAEKCDDKTLILEEVFHRDDGY